MERGVTEILEMNKGYEAFQAYREAERCLLCYDAPCNKGCPANTRPADFIRKLRFKNIKGAIKVIKENNILGGICGVICPTCNLCEKECTATGIDKAINIGKIQRFLIEHSWSIGFNPLKKYKSINKNRGKVAVIGSGPAGLSCAAELAKNGFEVIIFEEQPKPGGALRYAIPYYRLSENFIDREIQDVIDLGVEIKCNYPIKSKEAFDEIIKQNYKAIFIATGVWKSMRMGIPNQDANGIWGTIEFLEKVSKSTPEEINQMLKDKQVLVIGGGDVAMDSAETAKRYGAKEVYIVYRRSLNQMPANPVERERAINSGIHFLILTLPVEYVVENGKLKGIKAVRIKLGEMDKSGRPTPIKIEGSEHFISADMVIEAIGLEPKDEIREIFGQYINISDNKIIIVDETSGKTSMENIYAGGDIIRGSSLVVKAIADGKKAAESIIKSTL